LDDNKVDACGVSLPNAHSQLASQQKIKQEPYKNNCMAVKYGSQDRGFGMRKYALFDKCPFPNEFVQADLGFLLERIIDL
jgi:hypothetical protein